ncbi:MAG: S-layer homology domain-containing protein [Gudongella sp.]|jgi:hypothetical protein|nr:S-layer homology domain-containing protein [Gudongella sp.]
MKAKWLVFLMIAFALLVLPMGVYAAEADYDAGYARSGNFFSDYPDYYDGRDAYDAFKSMVDSDKYDVGDEDIYKTDYGTGFVRGYNDRLKDNIKTNYAEAIGRSMGQTAALEDFYRGAKSNWSKAMPSDRSIIREFNLGSMTTAYEDSFVDQFRAGFRAGYEEAYEKALLEPAKQDMDEGLKNGAAAGGKEGTAYAQKDYLAKLRMNYERDMLGEREILDKFGLRNLAPEYRDAFVEGYRNQYMLDYNKTYRGLSGSQAVNKTISEFITAKGGILTANGLFTGIPDPGIRVEIEPGTFYMPTHMTIDTMNVNYYQLGTAVRASELYRVLLDNPAVTVEKDKYITLSFPYYGDSLKAGIYKFINEKWYYLPSVASDGVISTQVAPDTLSNRESVYAVFMDNSVRVLTDVRFHWAKDEIETMVRRGVILGYPGNTALDGTFKPEQNITRAEFLILLSRIENWVLPNYVASATYFNDYQTFSTYDRIISYGLNNKYILGYTDRTFRPFNPISYYEVELIMGRVLRDPMFRWNNIATQMMYDKQYRSPSFLDLNRKITRAEVAYMLYKVNEWRY